MRVQRCLPHSTRRPARPGRCSALVRVLRQARAAPLLSMAVAEALAAVACAPGSRTTDPSTLETLLQARAAPLGVLLRCGAAARAVLGGCLLRWLLCCCAALWFPRAGGQGSWGAVPLLAVAGSAPRLACCTACF